MSIVQCQHDVQTPGSWIDGDAKIGFVGSKSCELEWAIDDSSFEEKGFNTWTLSGRGAWFRACESCPVTRLGQLKPLLRGMRWDVGIPQHRGIRGRSDVSGPLTKPVSIHLSSFAALSMIGRHAIDYSRPVVRLGEFDFYETTRRSWKADFRPKGKVPAAYTIVYTSTDVNADRNARAHGNSRSSKLLLHGVDLFLGSTGKLDATLPLCRCKAKVLPTEKLCQSADRKTRARSRGSVAG